MKFTVSSAEFSERLQQVLHVMSSKPITPTNLDYAVKTGMTTNAIEWTEEEKRAARDLIGASDSGIEITDGEPTKESTVLTLDPNAEKIHLYTAEEIDSKVEEINLEIDNLKEAGTVEVTSGEPAKESTVMTIDLNSEEIEIYTKEEIDAMFDALVNGNEVAY